MGDNDDGTVDDGAGSEDEVAEMYGAPGSAGGDRNGGEGSDSGEGGEGGEESVGANLDAPVLGGDDDELEEVTSRFYVKHTEDVAVTLHEVGTEQIYTLVENPGFDVHEILDATIVESPPLGVSYLLEEIHERETIPVEYSDQPPTRQVQQLVTDMDRGQAAAIEREGEGEIHILHVDPEDTADTAEYVDEDETTYKNAARYGVDRVEVRTDEKQGIVSIRYLP
jgi:hypothetical protein